MRVIGCQRVPVEPGIELGTDVYLPDGPGPFPVLFTRTPYNRVGHQFGARILNARGYAVVAQDTRGRYDSDGDPTPLVNDANDGQKTIDWIANQKWCNGRIGLHGTSYPGIVQVPAASGGHEALKCIAPVACPGSHMKDWIRYDGCFGASNALRWSLTHCVTMNQPPQDHFEFHDLDDMPTLDAVFDRVGYEAHHLRDWVEHDQYDEYWQAVDQDLMLQGVMTPGLHVGGWFDHISRNHFTVYETLRDLGRGRQELVMGPYGHTNLGTTGEGHQKYGDWDFGPEAQFSILDYELRMHDYFLRDIDNGYTTRKPVNFFIMGINRWVGFDDYPVPGVREESWHLDSGGSANTQFGDGTLSRDAPSRAAADAYTYDPNHPMPVCGGALYWGMKPEYRIGPVDQRPVLQRPDVLVYRSKPLDAPLGVVGEPTLDLALSTDADDTDVVVKLCVELPQGEVISLANGSLRMRYREGFDQRVPMPKHTAVDFTVRIGHTAYVYPVGSRIVVTITSSDFPRIEPHLNTMSKPMSGDTPVVARHTFVHGPDHQAKLNLPILDGLEEA